MFLGASVCHADDIIGVDQMWNRGDTIVPLAKGLDIFISNG